jgi:transitional endoplasmic reticulum ATPase
LAKAVATEAESNFISVKGPEFLSKWVGESEKAVRETFRKAKQASPCVVFLDELDAIAPHRGRSSDSQVTERVISQILTELDGLEDLHNVTVIAATNRPDIIDPALLRSGRFDRLIYIPVPDLEARRKIFEIHTRDKPIAEDVDLDILAKSSDGFTGADIASACNEATMLSIRDFVLEGGELSEERIAKRKISWDYFQKAMDKVRGTERKDLEQYVDISTRFSREGVEVA